MEDCYDHLKKYFLETVETEKVGTDGSSWEQKHFYRGMSTGKKKITHLSSQWTVKKNTEGKELVSEVNYVSVTFFDWDVKFFEISFFIFFSVLLSLEANLL